MVDLVTRRLWRFMRAIARYAPLFLIEVLLFWAIIKAVDLSGYGHPSNTFAPPWYPVLSFVIVAVAMGAGEARFHLYRRVWSVAGLSDAFAIGLAVVEASLLVILINLLFPDGYRPFRVLAPVLATPAVVIAVGLVRLVPRLRTLARPTGNRLLVVIPDASGYATIKALLQHPNPDWLPVAVVTVGPADVGRTLTGIPVLGRADNLTHWMKVTDAQGVAFVQTASTDKERYRQLYSQCLASQMPVLIVAAADDWLARPGGSRLRQLSADDLVGRDQREIDLEVAAADVRDRVVLVTGAAGSIGSELCRLLGSMGPRRLVMLDINESGLFDLSEELRLGSSIDVRDALVSITDRQLLANLFAEERPDIVFHVAAYKHVPMLESHPIQAVTTNVVGTWNVVRYSAAAGVQKFVLISTDKAASKHSVMGCTKRLGEQIVLAHRGPMACWAVRFGNVVGSRGSVIPLFERQIELGGPVTITHPDMTRFMMTIREAASLVLSTLALARPARLYMLDMGEPIRILDLAHDLIRSRGLRPDVDIKIVFTGLRPGERLTEDLLGSDEGWRSTSHPSIREVVSPSLGKEEDLAWAVERFESLAREGMANDLVRALKNAVHAPARSEEEPGPEKLPRPTKHSQPRQEDQ